MRRDRRLDHRARLVASGVRAQIEAAHHVVDRTGGDRLALREEHHRVGEARDLLDRMADVDDRDVQIVAQLLDVAQDFVLAR